MFHCSCEENTFTLDEARVKIRSCEDEISELKNEVAELQSRDEISELKSAHQEEISQLKNELAELRSLIRRPKGEQRYETNSDSDSSSDNRPMS